MIDLNSYFQEPPRILVTGGAGFIGGALIRKLLKETQAKIFNLDKLGYASDLSGIEKTLFSLDNQDSNRYQFIKVDLSKIDTTLDAIKSISPDLIFHLAAESHVDRSIDNPITFLESNVIGTYNLLNAARCHWDRLPKTRKATFRFHHISTDEVFGSLGDHGRFSESSPYDPRSPYSASKAASDHFVSAWNHTYGLPVVITNCSNNYGPWQFPEKLIPVVILKALEGESIPLYGDGKNVRDWLYVEDHVDGLLCAALSGKIGGKYCIGGNSEQSNKQVVEKICFLLDEMMPSNNSYTSLIEYVKDRPGHDYRYAINPKLINDELNWSPSIDFEIGLRKTIAWYLENLDWCNFVLSKSGYSGERLGRN